MINDVENHAEELSVLRCGKWKDSASANRVIGRHLRFAQEWGGGTLEIQRVLAEA